MHLVDEVKNQLNQIESEQIKKRVDLLNDEFCSLFEVRNLRQSQWLISSVQRSLKASRLTGIDPWEIVTQAYLRAMMFVLSGGLIWNLLSWLKSTSLNITHELRRKKHTYSVSSLDECLEDHKNIGIDRFDLNAQIDLLMDSIEFLSEEDIYLIKNKVILDKSWIEIHDEISKQCLPEQSPPSIPTLRQKKHRALKRLKKEYLKGLKKSYQDKNK
ncbi:MAG: hypothetical protein WBA43_05145 [Elainellaceae cyanobacterium]